MGFSVFWETIRGGIAFLSYLLFIHLSMNIFQKKNKSKFDLRELVASGIGGGVGGFVITLMYHILTKNSTAESYITITGFLLINLGFMLGILSNFWIQVTEKISLKTFDNGGYSPLGVTVLLIIVVSFSILIFYVIGLNQITEMGHNTIPTKTITCTNIENTEESGEKDYTKQELTGFLSKNPDKDFSVIASLYLLSGKEKYSEILKNYYFNESVNQRFTGPTGGNKAKQYRATLRAAYYDEIISREPDFFTPLEKKELENWFYKINLQIFKVEWIDYVYAALFKKKPEGPYENQENGVGALSVFFNVSKFDNQIRNRNLEYTKEKGVGWSRNWRNPDDSFFYQGLWIKNAFFMSKYTGLELFYNETNLKKSFEWMLVQLLPDGLTPGYNNPDPNRFPLDVMVLGSKLLQDGRYKWIVNRMMELDYKAEMKNIYGVHYWEDDLKPIKPKIGSCYINGTTGIAIKPGQSRPDKIVFRDGWDKNSTYALLNLRFAGWHSYKGTNSYVVIYHGKPFIVEDIEKEEFDWMLPSSSRLYNDKKIDRADLNGIQVEKRGIEEKVNKITGLADEWSQTPPKYAKLDFLRFGDGVDYSRTVISDWNGWNNYRVSILFKNNFFIVIDHLLSENSGKVRSLWHLKGEMISSNNVETELRNGQYNVMIYHPNNLTGYSTHIEHENYSRRKDTNIHYSNIDLNVESRNKKRVNFILAFVPKNKIEIKRIIPIEVQGNCKSATGIKLEEYLIGSNIESSICKWGDITTDASLFIQNNTNYSKKIIIENVTILKLKDNREPTSIKLNGKVLNKNSWSFINEETIISLPRLSGELILKYT
jgi:hypothetical protein